VGDRLLLVDNYDSFTYNLAHVFQALGIGVEVRLCDRIDATEAVSSGFVAVVISPGPGRPAEAGATPPIVRAAEGRVPLLGVCLGHQAIAEAHGARIVPARALVHGKASAVHHDGRGLFRGLPQPLVAGRYHSLAVDPQGLDGQLEVAAYADDGTIMALRHRRHPVDGVQFHPESVLTPDGARLCENFLRRALAWVATRRAA
jgi:anthranilate synthase component 2